MRWGLKFILGINALVACATLFAYVSPVVDPSITWFFSFFAIGFPILIILNLAFLITWMSIKPKFALLPILTLALGWVPLQNSIGINLGSKDTYGLRIMSYNIGHTKYLLDDNGKNKNALAFQAFLQKADADLICVQERTKRHLDLYKQIFKGYSLYPEEFIGTCIYSRQPILDSGNIYFDTNAHNATWVEVMYKGQRIRIYSIHLSSNKIKKLDGNGSIREIWDKSLFILDKYNLHAVKRKQQLEKILTHAQSSPYPVVLTGDFNDVPLSHMYRTIANKYRDAFLDTGFGFGKTHKTKVPILRIDYAFHSEELTAGSQEVMRANFSDHYPLLTSVDLLNQ